jgi:hypothetical protein
MPAYLEAAKDSAMGVLVPCKVQEPHPQAPPRKPTVYTQV